MVNECRHGRSSSLSDLKLESEPDDACTEANIKVLFRHLSLFLWKNSLHLYQKDDGWDEIKGSLCLRRQSFRKLCLTRPLTDDLGLLSATRQRQSLFLLLCQRPCGLWACNTIHYVACYRKSLPIPRVDYGGIYDS